MNSYQRLSLINEIAIKLQQEMMTRKINILFGPYDLKGEFQSQVGSKRVYVQELLAKETTKKILKIARDLEMDLSVYKVLESRGTSGPTVWLEGKAKVLALFALSVVNG